MKRNIKTRTAAAAALLLLATGMLWAKKSAEAEAIYAQEVREASGTAAKPERKNPKRRYAGWYMRTKVYATAQDGTVYRHESAGVFGKLREAKRGRDIHDIPGYGAAILQVVFPHYDWGDVSGDYFTDYRKWKRKRVGKRAVWTFLVRNQHTVNLANAPLKIVVEGAQHLDSVKENGRVRYIETRRDPKLRAALTLVDVDNNRTYRVDELEDAQLGMQGLHTRTFRWVLGKVRKKDFEPLKRP